MISFSRLAQLGLPLWEQVPDENGLLYLANIRPYRNGPDPDFNGAEVSYLLYTRSNPNEGQNLTLDTVYNISSTNFNANLSTKIIIHDWLNDYESPIRSDLVKAFLNREDCNVVSEHNSR